jgi:hypothetical protein
VEGDELARLEREAVTSRTEAERIREGLRQWQARHVGCRFADRGHRWATGDRGERAAVILHLPTTLTSSEEDRQLLRMRVWCGLPLPDSVGVCARRDGHPGPCDAAS